MPEQHHTKEWALVASINGGIMAAIAKALEFLPNARTYIIIESDSESCLKTVMGAGEQWIAENYMHLNGSRVKNPALVNEITLRYQPHGTA
jgi:hypothetical protein